MASPNLPIVGAALRLHELAEHADWLAESQRDLEIQDPCYPDYLESDWRAAARDGRLLLERSGYRGRLGIHAVYDGIDLATRDRAIRAAIQQRLRESLDFAEEVGATHMVLHSPFFTFGSPFVSFMPAAHRQFMIDAVHAAFEPILPLVERLGCTIVLETIFDKHPEPLIHLVSSFGSEHVRMSIDTGHTFLMSQQGGPPPHQWVLEAGSLLGHLHLQDVDGHADRHWGVGDGNINWSALFRALGTLEHQPRLILEILHTPDVKRSANWLVERGLAG